MPLWGFAVFLVYAMRRVSCPSCGVKVETVPWASGKHQISDTYAWFLARWARRLSWQEVACVRSRIEPMKKMARTLRAHRPLLLNWFRARGQVSAGSVEGFNNKAKLTLRKSYGFRTYRAMEIALYHALGALPEPQVTHRFC